MNGTKKVLSHILGEDGVETLRKAIFKRGTSAVIDPLEYYLPLMVVPRSILSWLVQNVRPMKPGELKEVKFPGRDDIMMHIEKQSGDQYRCQFVQGGRVIHEFEKQSLPAMSAHLMTVGEQYDSFSDEPKTETGKKYPSDPAVMQAIMDEAEKKRSVIPIGDNNDTSAEVVRTMMQLNDISIDTNDQESVKWMLQHANVKELTSVIGKLVDALVGKKEVRDVAEKALDKMDETKIKDEQGKIETNQSPEEKWKKDQEKAKLPVTDDDRLQNTGEYLNADAAAVLDPVKSQVTAESKPLPAGAKATEGKVEKESMAKEECKPGKKCRSLRSYMPQQIMAQIPLPHGPAGGDKSGTGSQTGAGGTAGTPGSGTGAGSPGSGGSATGKSETLQKPYVSDAQRRWAHTDAGKKALGGEAAVHHWDEETKGKKLPEHVGKEEIKPDPLPKDPKTGKTLFPSGPGAMAAVDAPKDKSFHLPVLKAGEMPAGAGMAKKPSMPIAPKPPVPSTKSPAASAAKQAQASARGNQLKPQTPGAPKMRGLKSLTPKIPKPAMPPKPGAMPKQPGVMKTEKFHATESEIFKSECEHCGKPQFQKGDKGPNFDPCACFQAMKKDENGKPFKFVQVMKKADDDYILSFHKDADPESVKAFLLTLKARLLIKRRFGV